MSKENDKFIISTTEHHPKGELYLYDLKTKAQTRLTKNELYEAGAKFSPNENTIVASIQTKAGDSLNHSGTAEIFTFDVNGKELKQLTSLYGFSGLPDFSPNGRSIAFHNCQNTSCDIYVMHADGTVLENLTKGVDDNRWPRWSPDGKWIAFTKTIDENSDIYFISRDGTIIKPVIATAFRDEIAIFKPR